MSRLKLYTSREWLFRKYVVDRKTPAEMAIIAVCTEQTIINWLNKFGLIRR